MGLLEDATKVLMEIGKRNQPQEDSIMGPAEVYGKELQTLTFLASSQLNDAVKFLEESGYLEVKRYFGSNPYEFGSVRLTPRGRIEFERIQKEILATEHKGPIKETQEMALTIASPPTPVGSPYGFTSEDWELVGLDRQDGNRLIVVFGYQWASEHFDPDLLRNCVKAMFERALSGVASQLPNPSIRIDYKILGGGYGGHLFNQIARDIIGSDIAVFETSDLNPNVMIEMGVALTWGVRVLPIRPQETPSPPSDISGQTWAVYKDNGNTWVDPDHFKKLQKMVEMAARRKPTR